MTRSPQPPRARLWLRSIPTSWEAARTSRGRQIDRADVQDHPSQQVPERAHGWDVRASSRSGCSSWGSISPPTSMMPSGTARPEEDEDRGTAALSEIFRPAWNERTPVIIANVVKAIDEIARLMRSACWQITSAGEHQVKKAQRKMPLGFHLHHHAELFERAHGYVSRYY